MITDTNETVIEGAQFGAWAVVRLDRTLKRGVCACVCGTVRELSIEALTNGFTVGCGCRLTRSPSHRSPLKDQAAELAAQELYGRSAPSLGRRRSAPTLGRMIAGESLG